MVVENEVEESEVAAVFWPDTPVQEGSERIALHDAVEEPADLAAPPDELALDCRQHKIAALNRVKGLLDRAMDLIHR